MRCTLKSLAFHAERVGHHRARGGKPSGVVAKREDGRFGFVEIDCGLDVRLDPRGRGRALDELLALAERDCFVGASLTVARYEWRVNGEVVGEVLILGGTLFLGRHLVEAAQERGTSRA